MKSDLSQQVRDYSVWLAASLSTEDPPTPAADRGLIPVQLGAVASRRTKPRWIYFAAAGLATMLLVGGIGFLFRARPADSNQQVGDGAARVASSDHAQSTWCTATWTGVTIAPADAGVTTSTCPEPRDELERALVAIVDVFESDTFGGVWYDNGTDLVVAYVGDPPDLADLPGVARLVARNVSLASLVAEAEARNEAETDPDVVWRVDVVAGELERIEATTPELLGDYYP